jgi:F0F1-type ATP synthase membrane subunit b/b'
MVATAKAEASESSTGTLEAAGAEAKARLERADREATELLDSARTHATNLQTEARLEAEFAVRRITQTLAEGLRHTVTESLNTYLPLVDNISVERDTTGTNGTNGTTSAARKARSSS